MAPSHHPAKSKRPIETKAARAAADDLLDAGSEYSFPASDPPSYMGGAAIAGPPPTDKPPREAAVRVPTDPGEVKPGVPTSQEPQSAPPTDRRPPRDDSQ
jgi:hypothetical protein